MKKTKRVYNPETDQIEEVEAGPSPHHQDRITAYVDEYMIDIDPAAAAQRANLRRKRNGEPVTTSTWMLSDRHIRKEIDRRVAERSQRLQVTADDVVHRLYLIAFADPNELIELRRTSCRHCRGKDHGYQRTAREMAQDRKQAEFLNLVFDEQGGAGYDKNLPPNPACPECCGDGVVEVFPKDTRHLSEAGRALYRGVKKTRNGFEILMHDQLLALQLLGKHLGLFRDEVDFNVTEARQVIVKVLGPGQSMEDI